MTSFQPDPDFERFRRTITRQPVDRVPMCEALVGYGIQSQFLGRPVTPEDIESQVEFFYKAGYDFVPVPVSLLHSGTVTEESKMTRVLKKMVLEKTPEETDPKAWNIESTSFIHSRKDFETFPWQEAEIDFSALDAVEQYLPEGMKVVTITGKIFTLSWMLMGFSAFSAALYKEQDLIEDMFRKIAEIQYSALETILKKDYVGGIWIIDDLATSSGPMISPKHFQQYLFPWYKKMSAVCHDAGKIVIQHSDGVLDALMPDIINCNIDLIHPIDPTCNDIQEFKQNWGDKISLCGNVPNDMLQEASEEEVRKYVTFLLKEIAPSGGYCLAAGNSVPDWATFANYMAMRDVWIQNRYISETL